MESGLVHIRPGKQEPLKIDDKVYKSAYNWELTEKDLRKAAIELGETEDIKKESLRKLKKKLSSVKNIKYRQDDFYLLRYLRVRKYNVSKAYENVKLFYEERKKHPDFFTIPPDLKVVQEKNWAIWLPYADEEGRIIILLNFNRWNPNKKSFEEMVQTAANVADVISMNPACQINGVIGIYDLNGITLRHLSEILRNSRLWACLPLAQNGYPWRIKKFIVLNTNWLARILYNLLKPLVRSKIVQRCVLLGSDMNELHKHVNSVLLPKRLNGALEEEECDVSHHILNNLEYIKYERSFSFPKEDFQSI